MSININESGNTLFGTGADSNGSFIVQGHQSNNMIQFKKIYSNGNEVQYNGTFMVAHGVKMVKGQWQIPGNCNGEFELADGPVTPQVM